jgi:hypothetical protein
MRAPFKGGRDPRSVDLTRSNRNRRDSRAGGAFELERRDHEGEFINVLGRIQAVVADSEPHPLRN